MDINGGLLVKNVGKSAQFVLINSDPAAGGNNGFVKHTVGGTSSSSYAEIQGYYGTSVAGSTVIRLNPAGGNILIGTSTNNTGLLQVNGTIYATAFYESSDIRFKKVLETNPILDVLGIDVIKFTRTDTDKDQIRYGYSAQQVQEIIPEMVTGKDKLSVNYMDLHTLKIAALEKRIAELEAKLNKL